MNDNNKNANTIECVEPCETKVNFEFTGGCATGQWMELCLVWNVSLDDRLKQNSHVKRQNSSGRWSKVAKLTLNDGDHLPIVSRTRRHCSRCAKYNIERGTEIICTMCQNTTLQRIFYPLIFIFHFYLDKDFSVITLPNLHTKKNLKTII